MAIRVTAPVRIDISGVKVIPFNFEYKGIKIEEISKITFYGMHRNRIK